MGDASKSLILIYGSYGYTGNLIAELAVEKGYRPLLAGRNASKLKAQAERLGLPCEAFALSETAKLERALSEVKVVIHAAGPYSQTAKPMLEACMRCQTDYLDITGELEVFEWIASQHEALEEAGISALPGAGFDVVPTDCLAAYLKEKLPDAKSLELAFKGLGSLSRGTALTMAENAGKGGAIRKGGKIVEVPAAYKTKKVPFGNRQGLAVSIPWGDVSTAYHSTGIPNIIVYTGISSDALRWMRWSRYLGWLLQASPIQSLIKKEVKKRVDGPSEQKRMQGKCFLWGRVENAQGKHAEAQLSTPEGYTLTARTALQAAERLVAQQVPNGFLTPSKAFGADFILAFEGTERTDLT